MTDYPLARAQSMALVRSSSVERGPSLLARTYSVPDIGQHYRYSDTYTPAWRSRYSYTPYRYRRDYTPIQFDTYWYDRFYSSLYRTTVYPRTRYSYSDYLHNPYYSSSYSNYWTRNKGYCYNYDYPTYYRPYYYCGYDRYPTYTYKPYRSNLLGY